MLDLARQMGQHDTGYIPDQATLNFLNNFFYMDLVVFERQYLVAEEVLSKYLVLKCKCDFLLPSFHES